MSNYSRITMIDMRYLAQPLDEVLKLSNYDEVLFVYNIDTFNTDATIQNVN